MWCDDLEIDIDAARQLPWGNDIEDEAILDAATDRPVQTAPSAWDYLRQRLGGGL